MSSAAVVIGALRVKPLSKFALKYEIWEMLRHEKIPKTHILATLLAGKKIVAYQVTTIFFFFFRIFRFLEVCLAQV